MRRGILIILSLFFSSGAVFAQPDYYYGDANVYTGSSVNVPPNIMLLFDISKIMSEAGSAVEYNPGDDYIAEFENIPGKISAYTKLEVWTENNGKTQGTKFTVNEDNNALTLVQCPGAFNDLTNNGIWFGSLDNNGLCDNKSKDIYVTGNYASLIFELSNEPAPGWSISNEYAFGDIISSAGAGKFVCSVAGTSGDSEPLWDNTVAEIVDGTVKWQPAQSALAVASTILKSVANTFGDQVRLGVSVLNENNQGADILLPLTLPSDDLTSFSQTMDELAAFRVNGNHWQVNEGLWDMAAYFNGTTGTDAISSKIESEYPPAAQYWCQPNHIILITSGLDSDTTRTKQLVDDLVTVDGQDNVDEQGTSLDVAKHLYTKLYPDYLDSEYSLKVKTHVIQVFSSQLHTLVSTAEHGRGKYYNLSNAQQLGDILADLILGLLEVDSSFVAPVVPASPESQAYSGQRIYLGFFTPMNEEPWCGNIKKFALDDNNLMLGFDTGGELVSATDQDGNFLAEEDAVSSFWGSNLDQDGGVVDLGGVGEKLLDLTTLTRKIYTLDGDDERVPLSDPIIDESSLDVVDAEEMASLKDFIYGENSYNDTYDEEVIGTKRRWIKGDVMHSKPVIVNYKSFSLEDENDSSKNNSYIFVGGNDGMLHAYRDSDGTEAWAFIPPELLPHLKYLRDFDKHYYYVDGSPVVYLYDSNNDGNIVADEGDRALVIFGMRRGGGKSTLGEEGEGSALSSYYALDVTDPEDPEYMWKINGGNSTGFAEMGQTWSLPTPAKVKIGEDTKIVAVIGGGYDPNEDLRYGNTQVFPDSDAATVTSNASSGEGDVTSITGTPSTTDTPSRTPFGAKGSAVYFIEIATINDTGVVNTDNSGSLVKSFTFADVPTMTFSFAADPLVIDYNFDTYADTVYIGDTSGRMWRIDIGSSTPADWQETLIFAANGNDALTMDVGRKIFYKPTATISGYDTFLFFGTGDREHPLNTAVIDRFYSIRDRRVPASLTDLPDDATQSDIDEAAAAKIAFEKAEKVWPYTNPLTETNLIDVTENCLQDVCPEYLSLNDDQIAEERKTLLEKLTPPFSTDSESAPTWYGWYIKLDEYNHDGEKVLASARVFDGKVYFTTYQPTAHTMADDPCVGILGPARLYVVDAYTGAAVFNLDKGNDGEESVIKRQDRYYEVGRGIASEPIVRVDKYGNVSVMVGRGGGFFNSADNPDVDLGTLDPLFPVYWMKW